MTSEIRRDEIKQFLLTNGQGWMSDVVDRIYKYFKAELSPILLMGESGCGKEYIAKILLSKGRDFNSDILAINCGALSDELLLSELFGHKKGAFTGASDSRDGILNVKRKSGIFLDEIDKSSLWFQNSMLRYMRTGEIRKLGKNEPEPKIKQKKIVFATSASIYDIFGDFLERNDVIRSDIFHDDGDKQLVKEELERIRSHWKSDNQKKKEMAPDFLNRISSFVIAVPPLRHRKIDYAILMNYFIREAEKQFEVKVEGVTSATIDFIMRYNWPNNLAEFSNFIKMGVVNLRKGVITYPGCLKLYSGIFSMSELAAIPPVSNSELNDSLFEFSWGYLGIGHESLYAHLTNFHVPLYEVEPIDDKSNVIKLHKLDLVIKNLIQLYALDYSFASAYKGFNRPDLKKNYDLEKMRSYFSLKKEVKNKNEIAKQLGFKTLKSLNKWLIKNNIDF